MAYVDGFVIPVQKRKLPAYLRMARKAAKIFKEYGALEDRECTADDLKVLGGVGTPFPRLTHLKRGETIVFSWIVYRSKSARDRITSKVMKDPRMLAMGTEKDMPFDVKRSASGGFKVRVDA